MSSNTQDNILVPLPAWAAHPGLMDPAATAPLPWAAAESAPALRADSPPDWRWAPAWSRVKSWPITSSTAAIAAAVVPPAEASDSGFSNSDMGGSDFGMNDPGSGWDDGGGGGGDSGGGDWS